MAMPEEKPRYFQRETRIQERPLFDEKLFQIKTTNYLLSRDRLPMPFLESMFFFLSLNSALLTFYFTRSFVYSSLSCLYTSVCVITYGQSIEFSRALNKDLPQSLYARLLYRQLYQTNDFDVANQSFIKRFKLE